MTGLEEINAFLKCETPQAWIDVALQHQDILLIDHANCEKKAATTAMNLISKYIERDDLLKKMSQLAREELLHFEQVLALMQKRNVPYAYVSPARYGKELHKETRSGNVEKMVDVLIIGALIEARSCERFAKLAPFLDDELAKFYRSLLRSEARHFQDYLALARAYSSEPIDDRIEELREAERRLIESADTEFRFHSGIPVGDAEKVRNLRGERERTVN